MSVSLGLLARPEFRATPDLLRDGKSYPYLIFRALADIGVFWGKGRIGVGA